jgi:hypothetical protein
VTNGVARGASKGKARCDRRFGEAGWKPSLRARRKRYQARLENGRLEAYPTRAPAALLPGGAEQQT